MSEWLAIIVLAIVQGATEFLPVSSSGHLSLGHAILGVSDDPPVLVDVVLHVGTLVAVVGVYRRDLTKVVVRSFAGLARPRQAVRDPYAKLGFMVVLATAATTVIALGLKDVVEGTLRGPAIVGGMLMLNGAILWSSRRVHRGETIRDDSGDESPEAGLSWGKAGVIGVLQGLAVIPGISRSGTTITGALHMGTGGAVAARFSFLLSIPAILGALVLKLGELEAIGAVNWPRLLVGAAVAAVVGWVCLVLLLRLLNRARFHHFAWYCWALGLAAMGWALVG